MISDTSLSIIPPIGQPVCTAKERTKDRRECNIQGDVESHSIGMPASLIFFAVPPEPRRRTPAAERPRAKSRRSVLSYTDRSASLCHEQRGLMAIRHQIQSHRWASTWFERKRGPNSRSVLYSGKTFAPGLGLGRDVHCLLASAAQRRRTNMCSPTARN